jgi:hypothetical protein
MAAHRTRLARHAQGEIIIMRLRAATLFGGSTRYRKSALEPASKGPPAFHLII